MDPAQGLEALKRVSWEDRATQTIVVSLNIRQWRESYPKLAKLPLISDLILESKTPAATKPAAFFRSTLLAAKIEERQHLLESLIQEQVAHVFRIPSSRVTQQTSLNTLGLDSLLALEIRNRLETSLEVVLPAILVWGGNPTVSSLATQIAEKMRMPIASEKKLDSPEPGDAEMARLFEALKETSK